MVHGVCHPSTRPFSVFACRPRVSPLSVSVMLEIGRERVYGEGADEILAEAEAELLQEALA